MRASKLPLSYHHRRTVLPHLILCIVFLVLPESRARVAFQSEAGVKSLAGEGNKEREVSRDETKLEVLENPGGGGGVDALIDRIKAEVRNVQNPDNPVIKETKEIPGAQKQHENTEGSERTTNVGIRRFDSEVAVEELDSGTTEEGDSKGSVAGVIFPEDHQIGESRAVDNESKVEVIERVKNIGLVSTKTDDDQIEGDILQDQDVQSNASDFPAVGEAMPDKILISIDSNGIGKFGPVDKDSKIQIRDSITKPTSGYNILELLREKSAQLQERIADRTLFERVKEPTLVMPDIPLLSESEILGFLKSAISTIEQDEINKIKPFGQNKFNERQIQIIQLSTILLREEQKQVFLSRMFDCVLNLSVTNCLRILVYPILAEAVPQQLSETFGVLPNSNLTETTANHNNRTKAARSGAFVVYPSLLDAEELVFGLLRDVQEESRKNFESVPSYIDLTNETFTKFLSIGQMRILQTGEKLLPISVRPDYSDRMYSCIKRFEYFSCVKYFAWPMIKKYNPGLSDFPKLLILYPAYSEYPIVPFTPEQAGQLPEVVEADMKETKGSFDSSILNFLKSGTYSDPVKRISSDKKNYSTWEKILMQSFTERTPIGVPVISVRVPIAQFYPLHYARPFLQRNPISEATPQSIKCMYSNNYSACLKYYYSWPLLRQSPPSVPVLPSLMEWLQLPNLSQISQFFQLSNLAALLQIPDFSSFAPSFPGLPSISGFPVPTVPETPLVPQLPQIPNAPSLPSLPQIPNIPLAPPEATALLFRNVQGIRTSTVESRHHQQVKEEIPVADSQDGPLEVDQKERPNEQIVSQASGVKISSRKTEGESNVPIISITGNEFVPILSEKPESVIFTILRLYQISDPSLVNTLTIRFLNNSTPEYAKFLSLHQENTILLAKSMLPKTAQASFFEQMISCVRDRDFVSCSREIMFPTLSQYFPNLSNFPNFDTPDNLEKLMLTNVTKTLSNNQQISETNVKTDRHGEATVTITDTRFIPIFSEHPEGVVLNILRAIQISKPNLSAVPLRTREIINTPAFKNILSEKQVLITETAESLLPENLREDFIRTIIDCSRHNQFLDCTRDITFPTVSKYYPDLSSFPNFENQGSNEKNYQSPDELTNTTQFLRDEIQHSDIEAHKIYIQQLENHLQNEIENILFSTIPVNERSKIQNNDIGADHSMRSIPGALSKQQRSIMKMSDIILPESIRPLYHTRMAECMNSNSFVSCMQVVGWPLLRLNPIFLTQPLNPIPYFYHQENSLPSASYGPPGGLLGDVQLGEQSAAVPQPQLPDYPSEKNRPSSVESKTLPPGIPAQSGQQSAPSVNIIEGPAGPVEQRTANIVSTQISLNRTRKRRGITSLFDFYSKDEPDKNRGSVRKNLLKYSILNITEHELFQILTCVENSRHNKLKNSQPKTYFVDNFDSDEKKSLKPEQLRILRLVEDLEPHDPRGFMSQLWQCIRSLSLIRCAGIFILPMIVNNLPSLPIFNRQSPVSLRVEDYLGRSVEEYFGKSAEEVEKELIMKKEEYERVFLTWYKNLAERKFETTVYFLKIKGDGTGELSVSFTGLGEKREEVTKDDRDLSAIFHEISEPKLGSNENQNDEKRSETLKNEDTKDRRFSEYSEEDLKFKIPLKYLLEEMRNSDIDNRPDNYKQYLNFEDAHGVFESLFGSEITNKIKRNLESYFAFSGNDIEERKSIDDEFKTVLSEDQKKVKKFGKVTEVVHLLGPWNEQSIGNGHSMGRDTAQNVSTDNDKSYKKKSRTELSIKLPRLNDTFISKKVANHFINFARGLKSKMGEMMPGFGMLISFLLQMAISHARTAASVAGLLSNMALGMGMMSMIRDTFFGQSSHSKIKYVYDTDFKDPAVSWPKELNYWE